MNFECPLHKQSRLRPNQVAIITPEKNWTYEQCEQKIRQMTTWVHSLCLSPSEKIAIVPTLHAETILLFFTLLRMKHPICPINLRTPKGEIPALLERLGTSHLIQLSDIKETPEMDTPYELRDTDIATYLFTSGSSATPKIACHSIGNHYYSALGSIHHHNLVPSDRWQLSLPLFHIGGIAILFRSFLAGASVLISDTMNNATHLSLVPTQFQRILNSSPKGYKCILLGGAKIPLSLYKKGMERGFPLELTYGMTEMSSQIISNNQLLRHRELKIQEDKEILVRGKTLFQGYYSKDDGLSLPVDAEGWFHTKDLGKIDPQSGMQFLGRKDRLFISGGENIQPEEIENALYELPGMVEVYVILTPDKEFGERSIAIIHSKIKYRETQLRSALEKRLPKYKIPIAFFTSSDSLKQGELKLNLRTLRQWVKTNNKLYKICS